MATYYVSGVWKDANKAVTFLNVHLLQDGAHTAKQYSKDEVIKMITAGNEFYTCNWNYSLASWSKGAKIGPVREGNYFYLRTGADSKLSDNLDNMLPAANLNCQ